MLNCDAETGVCSLPESPDKALSHVPLTARFLRLTKRFHSLTGRHSDYFGAFSADEAGIELYQRLNSWYPAHCCSRLATFSMAGLADDFP